MCVVLLSTVLNIGVSESGSFHLDFQNNNFNLITIIIIKWEEKVEEEPELHFTQYGDCASGWTTEESFFDSR